MEGIISVLIKAIAYIGIIVAGYGLKKAGIFRASDFYMLSKIIITITLPCATITTFSKNGMDTFVPFAPAASATPLTPGSWAELSSALSSIEILISIVAIVVVLILVL